jgi:hypothetical protein
MHGPYPAHFIVLYLIILIIFNEEHKLWRSHNGTDERQEEIVHIGLGGMSSKFVWENVDSFPSSRETFCNVHGPQFNTAECVWKHFWYCPCTTHCRWSQQQEISKSIRPLTFCSRIRKWEDVTVDNMYVVLPLFMLLGIIQKPALRSYYKRNQLLFTPFFFSETSALERLEVIMKFMRFSDNSKQNEYQGPPKLFKIFPVVRHLNNKFQTLCLPKENCGRQVLEFMERSFVFQTIHTPQGCKIWQKKHMNSASLALARFGLFLFILEKARNKPISL